MKRLDATVLLTHLNDPRGVRALTSIADGTAAPAEVVVADGGSEPAHLEVYRRLGASLGFPVHVLDVPGTVADSREQAWPACHGRTLVFLDTDEVATPQWLERLTAPLRSEEADFAAGPTEPLSVASRWDRYHARVDEWFYRNFVARDVVYAPMGNSAWTRRVFETLQTQDGHVFDRSLGRGGEDFDVNIRALQAGFRGRYVPQAVVRHDYSNVQGYRKVLRKKRDYGVAEFRVRRRHAQFLARRAPLPRPGPKPWSAMELVEPFVRRWAWLVARRGSRASGPPKR